MRSRLAVLPIVMGMLAGATDVTHAGMLNLRWDACRGDGGMMNRSFACHTNTGSHQLVGSFISPVDISNPAGNEIIVDVAVAGGSLPAWWQFRNQGSCRLSALTATFIASVNAIECIDWASGQAVGGIADYTVDFFGPGSARIRMASAIPPAFYDLFAGQEYFSFNLLISNAKTVGAGACAGCDLGACIAWKYLKVTSAIPGSDVILQPTVNASDSDDRLATWQGGVGVVYQGPAALNCPRATPVRGTSWGAVKALYR